jgi:hypothetical protein
MLITTSEAETRLNSEDNIVNRRQQTDYKFRQLARVKLPEASEDSCAIAPMHNGGRRPGDKNLDSETRAVIGAEAQVMTLSEVSEAHGVSLHHAHELKHGKITNESGQDAELIKDINEKLEQPHDIALRKLTKTLLAIDDEKLKSVKPRDLAAMASSLSKVADHTAPIKREDPLKDCRLIVYAPTVKQENHYESVEAATPVSVNS